MSGRARMRPAAGVDDCRTRKKSEKGSDNGVSRPAGGQVRAVDHVGKAESVPPKWPAVAWPADALKAHSWTRARCQTGQGRHACERRRSGDVMFEKVAVLDVRELDRDAFLGVTHDAGAHLADVDGDTDLRFDLGAQGRA